VGNIAEIQYAGKIIGGIIMHGQKPREIKSDLKSYRIKFEDERPDRWPYMKLLREYSTLKKVLSGNRSICGSIPVPR